MGPRAGSTRRGQPRAFPGHVLLRAGAQTRARRMLSSHVSTGCSAEPAESTCGPLGMTEEAKVSVQGGQELKIKKGCEQALSQHSGLPACSKLPLPPSPFPSRRVTPPVPGSPSVLQTAQGKCRTPHSMLQEPRESRVLGSHKATWSHLPTGLHGGARTLCPHNWPRRHTLCPVGPAWHWAGWSSMRWVSDQMRGRCPTKGQPFRGAACRAAVFWGPAGAGILCSRNRRYLLHPVGASGHTWEGGAGAGGARQQIWVA